MISGLTEREAAVQARVDAAYEEGGRACRVGLHISCNPYQAPTEALERVAWVDGFVDERGRQNERD